MKSMNRFILFCMFLSLHAETPSEKQKIIKFIDLNESNTLDVFTKILKSPPYKLVLEGFSQDDFMFLYNECLGYFYPMSNIFIFTTNSYTLYLNESEEFNIISSALSKKEELANLYCKSSSAGVSASANTDGNKKIEVDISSSSDDGKVNVRASAGYYEGPDGHKTGSAQIEARFNFGGGNDDKKQKE